MKRKSLLLGLLFASAYSQATPFDTCPTVAYLIQGETPAAVYTIDLVTGNTNLVAPNIGLGAAGFNAAGFNENDGYLYGFDFRNLRILRMGSDFQAEVISISNLPTYNFSSGDVYEDHLYLYNQNHGIFKINLTPLVSDSSTVLSMETVINYSSTQADHADIAIHPSNGKIYGIDRSTSDLYEYSRLDGTRINKGNTGLSIQTYGALYFDGSGYLYVGSNSSGNIYRIDLTDPNNASDVTAQFFVNGPAAGSNDGARCASAMTVTENSTIDFGDAPDTYSTTLAANGPRHNIDGVTWLGPLAPDSETDGQTNDNLVGSADEDGVGFVTALSPGLNSLINVTASTSGYLSAWFDWNRDGDFDDAGENIFSDEPLVAGSNPLQFLVSNSATAGSSWSRFRFSQQTGLSAYGGAASGEVEDHPITLIGSGSTVEYFPSSESYATVAFEDTWPYTADYDMNDVVITFRITETRFDGIVDSIQIIGDLAAYGASYKNGFAIRLPGILRTAIEKDVTTLTFNGVEQTSNGLESLSNEAIFIISDDLSAHAESNCPHYRTQSGCNDNVSLTFTLNIYFNEGSDRSALQAMPYDPFIFATPQTYHGDGIIFQPGRKWEVHLADQAPTEQFDGQNLFGLGADASNPVQGMYFKTANNLPWALLIIEDWNWPQEKVDMIEAYPVFQTWAESGGILNSNWHTVPTTNKCYLP
ncbi:TPA: LruC domain-containing protein [Photobacterium damselae]